MRWVGTLRRFGVVFAGPILPLPFGLGEVLECLDEGEQTLFVGVFGVSEKDTGGIAILEIQ